MSLGSFLEIDVVSYSLSNRMKMYFWMKFIQDGDTVKR